MLESCGVLLASCYYVSVNDAATTATATHRIRYTAAEEEAGKGANITVILSDGRSWSGLCLPSEGCGSPDEWLGGELHDMFRELDGFVLGLWGQLSAYAEAGARGESGDEDLAGISFVEGGFRGVDEGDIAPFYLASARDLRSFVDNAYGDYEDTHEEDMDRVAEQLQSEGPGFGYLTDWGPFLESVDIDAVAEFVAGRRDGITT